MIRMRNIAAALSLTLPLALGASNAAAEDMKVEATITGVNEDARSLTVEFDETGATETFRVDEDTDITFLSHQRGIGTARNSFEDLRAGQDVVLEFDDEILDGEWVIVRFITVS
jgi:hypothetical protein